MYTLYNIGITIAGFVLKIIALFNKKISLFVKGRKGVLKQLQQEIKPSDKVIWMHCASLGEFEQGRPIIEELKDAYPAYKLVLTFYSPSGYEVRKDYQNADAITYLPLDTNSKVQAFLDIVHPDMAIFVKYEFWPNMLRALKQRSIHTILVSGIFRKEQSFFKKQSWMRKALYSFDHFFVQNEISKSLLEGIEFTNVTLAGDTRFDRVAQILEQDNSLEFLDKFKGSSTLIVVGSSWEPEEKMVANFLKQHHNKDVKALIAPHNINSDKIKQLKELFSDGVVLYSTRENESLEKAKVFIADTIGILTKIYSYADIAIVGGAFETGLHNILEPATFGVPVLIGPHYEKFQEAIDLVGLKGAYSVENEKVFLTQLNSLIEDRSLRLETGKIAGAFVQENTGATEMILKYIKSYL
ncbi:glycosyltransferase N-terminal domain-containing protein [Urechidicola sp. KH5]